MNTGDLLSATSVAFGAATHAVTGLGFSIVCVPALTIAYGGRDGVLVTNFLSLGVNILVLAREGRHADLRRSATLLVPATVAAIFAAIVIHRVNANALSVTAGAVVLLTVGALALGKRAPSLTGLGGAVLAGSVSGAMNVVAGIGGPTVASYASNADWPAERLRPTLASYFLGLNAVSVAARGAPSLSRGLLFTFAIALVIGYVLGAVLRGRVNTRHLQYATLALAATGALAAIVKGFV